MLKVILLLVFLGVASIAHSTPPGTDSIDAQSAPPGTDSIDAHSAAPSPESIDALLSAARTEKLLGTMLANVDQVMRQSMSTAMQGQQLSAQQQQVIDAARTNFMKVVREEFTWDKMRPVYVQIYEETFTQEEIDGLIAFYKTPAGAAYVEKMPMVMQKSMSIMQSRIAPMMEKMKTAMRQAIADAKAAK